MQRGDNANEIIKNLWLGNAIASNDINFLKKNNIKVIINCTKTYDFMESLDWKTMKYKIPVHDNLEKEELFAMINYLRIIVHIINHHLKKGEPILVHCAAGMQRSAIVVLAYLYKYSGKSIYDCIDLMKKKRPIVFYPLMNFKPSICEAFNIFF